MGKHEILRGNVKKLKTIPDSCAGSSFCGMLSPRVTEAGGSRGGCGHLNRELHFSGDLGHGGDASELDVRNSPAR